MSDNGIGSNRAAPTPEQYRRRRIVAGAIAVLVLLLLIWGMASIIGAIRGSGNDTNAGAVATATSAPFSDFSERPSASSASESAKADASASAEASESASAEASESAAADASASAEATETATPAATETASAQPTVEPTETATPEATPATVAACNINDLAVALTTDQQTYVAGANPAIAVTYTNTAGTPCTVGSEAQSVSVNITSGPAQVYNSAICQPAIQTGGELAAGASNTVVVTWPRQLNSLGCGNLLAIKPGHYWATASVNGVASQPVRIVISG